MTTTTLDFKKALSLSKVGAVIDNGLARQVFFTVLLLLGFGVVEVFSASRYQAVELKGNPYYFGLIHLMFVCGVIAVIFLFQFLPKILWKKFTWLGIIILLTALLAVFFFPSENGAHRWIPLGLFTIQPSEFAKIGVVMLGALLLYKVNWDQDKTYAEHLFRFTLMSLPIWLIALLILLQPDLGNILVLLVAYIVMFWSIKQKWRNLNVLIFPLVGIVAIAGAVLLTPYRRERVITYFEFMRSGIVQDEFGKGLQIRNILIGVGSGGMWGKGIGGSQLKHGYFVEVTAFTDSIAAVIFEELGFFLGSVFVFIYLYLFYLFIKISEVQKSEYQRLIMLGIAMWFIVQTFIHFGANVALIPVKGTTLPFISYGGSSLIAFGVATGIAIRLARSPSETV